MIVKKVIAIATAFYMGSRVRPGTELSVPDDLKGSWFAPAESEAAQAAAPKVAKTEPRALSKLGKASAKSFIDVHGGKGQAEDLA